jgi:hypothetical protein
MRAGVHVSQTPTDKILISAKLAPPSRTQTPIDVVGACHPRNIQVTRLAQPRQIMVGRALAPPSTDVSMLMPVAALPAAAQSPASMPPSL